MLDALGGCQIWHIYIISPIIWVLMPILSIPSKFPLSVVLYSRSREEAVHMQT